MYDGQLTEIARELSLHVRREGGALTFDLEKDAERTLLLDQVDEIRYVVRTDERRARRRRRGAAARRRRRRPRCRCRRFYDSDARRPARRASRVSLSRGPDGAGAAA